MPSWGDLVIPTGTDLQKEGFLDCQSLPDGYPCLPLRASNQGALKLVLVSRPLVPLCPFEPLEAVDLKDMSLKKAQVLILALAKPFSDIQVLVLSWVLEGLTSWLTPGQILAGENLFQGSTCPTG